MRYEDGVHIVYLDLYKCAAKLVTTEYVSLKKKQS